MQSIAIDFVPSHGRHTGQGTAEIFLAVIKNYKLENKIQGIILDNTLANITSMQQLSTMMKNKNIEFNPEDQHFRCCAHIVNLAVQNILRLLNDNDVPEFHEDDVDESDIENNFERKPVDKLRALFLKIKRSE